jgi:serine/threonine-protein kinase
MTRAEKYAQPQPKRRRGFAGRQAFSEALLFPQIENFTIHEKLGCGGMASVYGAIDSQGEQVALKLCRKIPRGLPNRHLTDWFIRECAATLLLSHPNIVSSFKAGETEDYLYLSLEKINGKSLFRLLSCNIPTGWEVAREILLGISSAMEEIHRAGIVHRDIKPENVIVARGFGPKIIDFGLCHISGYDEIYGHISGVWESAPRMTPANGDFATPEVRPPEYDVPGASYNPQFDIYSAGLVFYNVVAGVMPFKLVKFRNITERLEHYSNIHKTARFPAPSSIDAFAEIPPAAEEALMACLEKNPTNRPPASDIVKIFGSC